LPRRSVVRDDGSDSPRNAAFRDPNFTLATLNWEARNAVIGVLDSCESRPMGVRFVFRVAMLALIGFPSVAGCSIPAAEQR
jgi:hypothetical protein